MSVRALRAIGRRRLSRLVHAARTVQHSADPFAHLRIAGELEQTALEVPARAFGRLAVHGLQEVALVCLRQRVLEGTVYLDRELLPALTLHLVQPRDTVDVGVPAAWRRRLRAMGVRCSRLRSLLRWGMMLAKAYKHGARSAIALVRVAWMGDLPAPPTVPYAVLMHLGMSNVPRRPRGAASHDFVTWYRRSPLAVGIERVWAHVPTVSRAGVQHDVVVTPFFFPRLPTAAARVALATAVLWRLAATLLRWLATGAWWEVVMLEQLLDWAYARRLPPAAFARAYVFHNASFGHRPLWTYAAEAAGASVDLVFYATNIETFGVSPSQPRPDWPGYRGMTWMRYGVWDSDQADLLRELGLTRAPIVVLGPVGFTDDAETPASSSPYVAVFDVTPQRITLLALRGIPQPYYTDTVWTQFLTDIADAVTRNELALVYKKKREIGKVSAAGYRARLAPLLAAAHGTTVAPDVAAQHLIVNATAVISMPFTSTALIARELGKPSVYYDPLGVLVGETRLAHGIPVIGTKAALVDWLGKVTGGRRIATGADGFGAPALSGSS